MKVNNSAHFKLLCLSLSSDERGVAGDAEMLIASNSKSWDELCVTAEIHAVRPQLLSLLRKVNPSLVPSAVLTNLDTAVKENLYQQLRLLGEFFAIVKMLEEVGVRVIPFKGFSLGINFYKDLAERESADVDLFIHAKDLANARQLMYDRSYVAEAPLGDLTDDYILSDLCEFNFDRYDDSIRAFHVEMHWRPGMTALGMDINLQALENQVIRQQVQQQYVEMFSASAHLLLIILHHGGKDQFCQLKQIMDISRVLNKAAEIDWIWVCTTLKQYNAEKLLYVGVRVASIITGVAIPAAIKHKADNREVEGLALNRIRMLEGRQSWEDIKKTGMADLQFRLRTRTSGRLRMNLITTELRTMTRNLLPAKFHPYFFNKNIRRGSGAI